MGGRQGPHLPHASLDPFRAGKGFSTQTFAPLRSTTECLRGKGPEILFTILCANLSQRRGATGRPDTEFGCLYPLFRIGQFFLGLAIEYLRGGPRCGH